MVATAGHTAIRAVSTLSRGSHKSHSEDAFAQYKFINQLNHTYNALSYTMDNNPTSHTPSPSLSYNSNPSTKKLKATYLMMILLTNPVTGHPTIIKSD